MVKASVRRFVSVLAVTAAVAASVAVVASGSAAGQLGGFGDVAWGAYYAVPVSTLAEQGVFAGTECGEGFCPDKPIDRKTMAVWIVRVLDDKEPSAVPRTRFNDVEAAGFHAPFVERMAELGVTSGCGDGSGYCPDTLVSRAQMAVFLSRAYELPDGPDPGFSDVAEDAWYATAVAKLAASGITSGCGDGAGFCPSDDTTRAQMATFLWRAENRADTASEPGLGVAEVLALLDALTVAVEQQGGYDRGLFRHWIDADGDGCDTRREVLLEEAVVAPTRGAGCSLADGEWISRYDGLTELGSGRGFDVDHLVPLAEAWESGAHGWSSARREQYANDLGYEHSLIAVSARSNRSKGAQDPATWLPPEAGQQCWYAAAWVHVKTRWTLTMDTTEVTTLRSILSGCSDAEVDVGLPGAVVEEEGQDATPETPEGECHPAYTPCLPNLPGDALNCGDLTSDQKPVTVNEIGVDPYRLDRDGDGRGCTS